VASSRRPLRNFLFSLVSRLIERVMPLVVELRPIGRYADYRFGDGESSGWRWWIRWQLWRVCRRFAPGRVVIVQRYYHDMLIKQYLGTDISRCLFVAGCYEPNEMDYVNQLLKPGDVVLDVGANEGLFTLLASGAVGTPGAVVAVEPSRRERSRLSDNVKRNQLSNVTIVEDAVSDTIGRAVLKVADPEHTGQNTLGGFAHNGVDVLTTEAVSTTTLDDLAERLELRRIDLVKLDIEGGEAAALRGALALLREFRPIVMLELQQASLAAQGSSADEVLALLREESFDLFEFEPSSGRLRPMSESASLNMVAVPSEKVAA
jgi:FkbM family methyltransferase